MPYRGFSVGPCCWQSGHPVVSITSSVLVSVVPVAEPRHSSILATVATLFVSSLGYDRGGWGKRPPVSRECVILSSRLLKLSSAEASLWQTFTRDTNIFRFFHNPGSFIYIPLSVFVTQFGLLFTPPLTLLLLQIKHEFSRLPFSFLGTP